MPNGPLSEGVGSGKQRKIRVFLADDHPMMREGLKAFLTKEPDLEVVGESADGVETIAGVKRTDPDVLVLDIMMPGLNGLDVCRQLAQGTRRPSILMLTVHDSENYIATAFRNGATGYCVKGTTMEELIRGIRMVADGKLYLPPNIMPDFLQRLARGSTDAPESVLSDRERGVLILLADGLSIKEIAARLCLSAKTVEAHRANIMRKLELNSVAELVKYALRVGLTSTS